MEDAEDQIQLLEDQFLDDEDLHMDDTYKEGQGDLLPPGILHKVQVRLLNLKSVGPPKMDIKNRLNTTCIVCKATFDIRKSLIDHCQLVRKKFKTKSGLSIPPPPEPEAQDGGPDAPTTAKPEPKRTCSSGQQWNPIDRLLDDSREDGESQATAYADREEPSVALTQERDVDTPEAQTMRVDVRIKRLSYKVLQEDLVNIHPTNASCERELQAASTELPWPLATPSISSAKNDLHLWSEEEGSSGMDNHGLTPYSCNNSSCSSQENITTSPTELELAVERDLIEENLSRSQAEERVADLQFHDPRRPQPGGHRSSPAATKPNLEHAQEGVRGSGAPLSAMAVRHSEAEGSDRHSDRNHCTEHTNLVNKRLLDKIEKRREEEEQHVAGLSEVFQARLRSHSEGYSLIDRRTYIERLNRDKGNLREREGVLAGLDTAMDIVEADRAEGRSSTSTEASEGSGREAPPRPLTRREPRVKEEAPSRQDASTPEFRGHSRSPRAPLASPGLPPTTSHTASPAPFLQAEELAGPPPGQVVTPCSKDHTSPFNTAAAGAGKTRTCFKQALDKLAIGSGGDGIFHGSDYGAGSSGAGPPLPTSPPSTPAHRRAVPTTKALNSPTGGEEEGEAHLDAHQVDYHWLGSYVNLDNLIHAGPGTGVLEKEDTDAELSERAREDHHCPN